MKTQTFTNGNHVLVGLGGTGGKILRAFKMRLFEEFHEEDERNKLPVALLYVDSTDEMMPKDGKARADFRVMGKNASFTRDEFLNIKAVDVEYILDHIGSYPLVKSIVSNVSAVKSAIGSLGQAAGQKRRAGRLLFAANAIGYVNSLRERVGLCQAKSGISGDSELTHIHIFAGLSGGTGSGSIIDAVIQARKTYPDAKISVYAMIPEKTLPKSDMDQGRYYPNGFAAMQELNALQVGRWQPQDVTGTGPAVLYNDRIKGVADGLTVYSNVNENGEAVNSLEDLPRIVSDYIFARIFQVNENDQVNSDIIRAYNFENMDDYALEFDETANPGPDGRVAVARTKKINSFGIKRVMYPELRILKHITYTVGESILYQFKYNNWRENQGFVNEERNKDYRKEYLSKDNLSAWMLDDLHLTLEKKVLESDADYSLFLDYWQDKAIGYADQAKKDDPLNDLNDIMNDFFNNHFRDEGVENFYLGKERAIPDIAREIRHRIEGELFEKWKLGDVSIVELQKVSRLLLEYMSDLRKDLEIKSKEEADGNARIEEERIANVVEWSRLGILQRMVGVGARRFGEHKGILTDYFVSKTMLVAWEFAKKLAARVYVELGKMDADISAFGKKINDALDETERLVTAQRKVNKGLEDYKSAIIEVSEEEMMGDFEVELITDKVEMPNIARQIRERILPMGDFINFGRLANDIDIDIIKDAFDLRLSEIVKTKHNEKAESENKVLGLNILTQLQQKLRTEDQINEFASKIINQSGVYLKLNAEQLQRVVRNNEGEKSPHNTASINKKTILISIPSPEENEGLKRFADKLEKAFKQSVNQSVARTTIVVNRKSPRKDELSIITVTYCFPMRAIDWLHAYKEKYDRFLHTGNTSTDIGNAILLHSEGDGRDLPPFFVVENAEEVAATKAATQTANVTGSAVPPNAAMAPPPINGMASTPPPIAPAPDIKLFIAVGGQQYGPYGIDLCRQMVIGGQLTPSSMVWMEGLPAWTQASHVPALQSLFAPPAPPAMPPLPPVGKTTPPSLA
ncbi:MAG: DUF4339 domain-containing protein [Prevotella sp.]|nr:DUF4339 domain-containing protein [Prevotella sp.]